jgi:hypothetical protein
MRIRRPGPLAGLAAGAALFLLAVAAPPAGADWLQPDASFRDAQLSLRLAVRDTIGRPLTAARLDSLGEAHLRLADLGEAGRSFARALALSPGDEPARAGLGRIALLQDDPARAESLLVGLAARAPDVARDLFHARLRQGRWEQAADLAEEAGETGRAARLRRLVATGAPWRIEGPERASLPWIRCWPVPIVKARVNGQPVLLAVETGVADLVLDPSTARRCGVTVLPEEAPLDWCGTRVAARMALAQRIELGGLRIENVPAATVALRRWSIEANPGGEAVGGLIGANLLARFTPTLDYRKCRLELERRGAPRGFAPDARRVPFELWGEREITVYGSIAAGRRMAMALQTGVPGCGVGAPPEVFEEVGLKAGAISRALGSAGRLTGGQPWAGVQVPTVTVGPVVQEKLSGCSGALASADLWRHGVRRDALLSSDFLRRLRVTVDWERRELVFE